MKIIVPSDNPNLLTNLLESIKENNPSKLKNVIVVTGEMDAMAGVAVEYGVFLIRRDRDKFNYARAINQALEFCESQNDLDGFFLLNDDTELLTPDGISEIEHILATVGNKIGVISAGIKGVAGTETQQAGSGAAFRLDPDGRVSFVATAISKECFYRVGFLDERYDAYGWEDIDYCTRAEGAGLGVGVYDGCVFAHHHSSTSFKKVMDVRAGQIRGERIYREKWATESSAPVFVVGTSNSGASVIAAMIGEMGVEMADPKPDHILSTSQYYRDTALNKASKYGEDGVRVYGYRRLDLMDAGNYTTFGSRLWPTVDSFKLIMRSFPAAKVIFVHRSWAASTKSFAFNRKKAAADARDRIEKEQADLDTCVDWAQSMGMDFLALNFDAVPDQLDATVVALGDYLGHEKGFEGALEVFNKRLIHFSGDGEFLSHPEPEGFGKIAVGARISSPHPSFVGCYAALVHEGMRDGDTLLMPTYRVPSHIAANELMRDFLATDADTLLLIDDDMTFDAGLLDRMRDNPLNWEYDVVSAIATQRLVPPRAIVMRLGEQPPLPDSLDGIYYQLVMDDVQPGKTMRVGATGMAFTLIRRSVLEAMTNEHGPRHTWYVQWGENGMGEDVWFCRRAGSLGYSIGVDVDAQVGHIGSVVYGYDEFDRWRKSEAKSGAGISLNDLRSILGTGIRHLPADLAASATDLLAKIRGK